MGLHAGATSAISEEDALRANLYGFLANQLLRAPDSRALGELSRLEGDSSPLGKAFETFAKIAAQTSASEASEEYEALFIGLGRGELVPYASYYLTGFLNEKPLAKLRNTMRDMGVERKSGKSEPEDHIGTLLEMMSGLIKGDYGARYTTPDQKKFFDAHIATWASHFFSDLEKAKNSKLYQPVGTIGRLFLEIETTAFGME